MNQNNSEAVKVVSMLGVLFTLTLLTIAGILWKGKANFPELIKHLTT